MNASSLVWRACFVLFAVFVLTGGPLHPDGPISGMLIHPDWLRAHLFLLAGFIAFSIGLMLFGRAMALSQIARRWLRLATIGTMLQAVEMALAAESFSDSSDTARQSRGLTAALTRTY